jgi:hypothetical protein
MFLIGQRGNDAKQECACKLIFARKTETAAKEQALEIFHNSFHYMPGKNRYKVIKGGYHE